MIKKIVFLSFVLGVGILPVFSKINGKISKDFFYDTDKTIMMEPSFNRNIKTNKYWEKNLFYDSHYSPVFMLSNKELYDLMPKEKISVVQRIAAPSIYSISLKNASIKTISLSENPQAATQKADDANQIKSNDNIERKIAKAIELRDSKNYIQAINILNEVTKKEPYNAYAFYLKAEIYYQQNDLENSMKNYVESVKINPSSKKCYLGIAKILELTNKQLAQKYYDKAAMIK